MVFDFQAKFKVIINLNLNSIWIRIRSGFISFRFVSKVDVISFKQIDGSYFCYD